MITYRRCLLCVLLIGFLFLGFELPAPGGQNFTLFTRNINFNDNWRFKRCEPFENNIKTFKELDFEDVQWETVILPHTPRLEPLVVNDQWQGICWYRKKFQLDPIYQGKKILIEFEAAMQLADVWVNGQYKTTHYGGYLPFTIDISKDVLFDKSNLIVVRLDNRDNPEIPPGKPLKELDFCMYGSLYRNVKLHITDLLHITDAVQANQVAGGGIFVRFPQVETDQAQLWVQTQVINESNKERKFSVITKLLNDANKMIAQQVSTELILKSLAVENVVQTITVPNPRLWYPQSPYLYQLYSSIYQDDQIIDQIITPVGIRRISFDAKDGFKINGEKCYLRGTNRHQEYPYIGYALSDNANYRDALAIKQAGFNLVRLSHYPHSPAFLAACDQLGIFVIDAIPGWQFFGDDLFQQRSYQDCRDLIRRDRNHPSVILWEVSLNESNMTNEFMATTQRLAHTEYPGDQCFTCGWQDGAYDVFIPARQHASAPEYWKGYNRNQPLLIAEYGDWEYYAQNAGFNQPEFTNLSSSQRNSRQLRGNGEKSMQQQVLNFQEALNDNLASPAVGCANWLMFDYNRGYANNIEASGIMDIFRIPKFAFYFYQSQQPPDTLSDDPPQLSPMLYIANYWLENSDLHVTVFSNCDQVKLQLNNRDVARQNSANELLAKNLAFPPITFKVAKFQAGELEASGWIRGKKVASYKVSTPLTPRFLGLTTNCGKVLPAPGKKDVFFVYASILDQKGRLVPVTANEVLFDLTGPGQLIGRNPIPAEAGIAAIVVETSGQRGVIKIGAYSPGLALKEKLQIKID